MKMYRWMGKGDDERDVTKRQKGCCWRTVDRVVKEKEFEMSEMEEQRTFGQVELVTNKQQKLPQATWTG
jgi:hypothetical protein